MSRVTVTDAFWHTEQELVRTAVIPFQWDALNDNVPGAAPSYCMHNFKACRAPERVQGRPGQGVRAPDLHVSRLRGAAGGSRAPRSGRVLWLRVPGLDFSKWIEAVGYSLAQHPDPELEATADAAIDIVCNAQLDNGYLDTYYILNGMDRAFTNLKDHHELYCLGHLVEGAVAYYQGTGKDKLLKAACRFADLRGLGLRTRRGQAARLSGA